MKVAIVKASDLAREGRWDASFHIALSEVRERVEELKRTITADEARKHLAAFSTADRQVLKILVRGSGRDSGWLSRVQNEYPHLSLAIMEKNLQPVIEQLQAKIETDQEHLDALLALQAKSTES